MRPAYFSATIAVSSNGIAASQKPLAAGNLLLNGTLSANGIWKATGDFGQVVTISSDGNDSGVTEKITKRSQEGGFTPALFLCPSLSL